jgi:O-methyltransferase
MNLAKFVNPDAIAGKVLVTMKAMFDTACLVITDPSKETLRFASLVFKVKPHYSMVRNENLKTLYDLVSELNTSRLAGDIVECGVWNGGSAAIMGVACMKDRQLIQERTIWLFDSFQGLPPPGEQDGDVERQNYFQGWNRGEVALVEEIFRKVGFPLEKMVIVPGWFNETLSKSRVRKVALLHIDADWYDSVKAVLEIFFDRVVPGGFVVMDDYGYWQGCSQALRDYFAEHRVEGISITKIGRQGAYFQKPF